MPVLPIIDMKKARGSQRGVLAKELHKALTTTGFFYLTGIEGYDADELLRLTTWFFGLKDETKKSVSKKMFYKEATHLYRGYFPVQLGEQSHKEGFEIGPSSSQGNKTSFSKMETILKESNQWPKTSSKDADKIFKERMEFYYSMFTNTGIEIMRLIAEGWNLDSNFFTPLFEPNHLSTFRLLHYPRRMSPPPPNAIDGDYVLQCDEHKDSGFLTLLSTFEYEGLQIRGSNEEWVDVPKLEGCLVVNIGELLATISGGVLKATNHRVVEKSDHRYSVPYFLEPSFHANINFHLPKLEHAQNIMSVKDLGTDVEEYGPWVMDKMKQFSEFRDLLKY